MILPQVSLKKKDVVINDNVIRCGSCANKDIVIDALREEIAKLKEEKVF